MATFTEVLFLLQFLVLLGVVLLKVFNLDKKEISFLNNVILFSIGAICFGLGFVTVMNDPENTLIVPLFYLDIGLFMVNVILFIVDLFRLMATIVGERVPKPYNSLEANKPYGNR